MSAYMVRTVQKKESSLEFMGQQGHHLQNAINNSCSTCHNTFGIYRGVYLLNVIYHILVMKNSTIWLYKEIALYPYYALLYNVRNPKAYPWALDTICVLKKVIDDGLKGLTDLPKLYEQF
ncbi:hypothetical protein C8F04DRAFT_1174881 [Mycena alexandri]|uniref:Uncharacterized protein n=1 Tax=Mycena alexandri TaxID=1745969 RepID=A0AAD6THP5_9AGAR|nr:hypothetical protein C8F04DRAFT_1174881 [Mycena alexandri]